MLRLRECLLDRHAFRTLLENAIDAIVELRHDSRKRGDSTRRTCTLEFWTLMIELGHAFGWKEDGATYVAIPIRRNKVPDHLKRDYTPGIWRDAKRVESNDAARWGNALGAARISPHLDNMTKTRRTSMGQPNTALHIRNRRLDAAFLTAMDEFIRYLHDGAFTFAAEERSDSFSVSSKP